MATLWIARHDPVFKFDLHKRELWLEGNDKKRFLELSHLLIDLHSRRNLVNESLNYTKHFHGIPLEKWEWLTSQKQYESKIKVFNKLKNDACPRISFRQIKNVRNLKSPQEIVKRFNGSGSTDKLTP